MFTDYESLITKVYRADNLTGTEKGDISDLISDKFLSVLSEMSEVIRRYYRNETGYDLANMEL